MTEKNGHFNAARWGRVCAFNRKTLTAMKTTPIAAGTDGVYTCVIAEEETASQGRHVWQIGFEWEMPRDVIGVSLRFDPSFDGAQVQELYTEYWQFSWPTQNPDRRPGGNRGWMTVDDRYHGQWTEAFGEITVEREGADVLFDHVDLTELDRTPPAAPHKEFNSSLDYNADYRRTLKLRLLFVCETAPVIGEIAVWGNPVVEERACLVVPCAAGRGGYPTGEITVWNGEMLRSEKTAEGLRLTYAANAGVRTDGDATLLQFAGEYPFAVDSGDISAGVYMEDYDLLLVEELHGKTPGEIVEELTAGKRSVFDRVPEHAEQTVANAFAEIPALDVRKQRPFGRYMILGWAGVRQKFCLRYNGDIFADKKGLKCTRRDTARLRWAGGMLHFRVATGDPPTRLEGKDECRQHMPEPDVPLYVTEWEDREIEYTQTAFATLRDSSLIGRDDLQGDEDIVVLCRLEVRNASQDPHTARFYWETYPGEQLVMSGGRLMATGRVVPDNTVKSGWKVQEYPQPYLRMNAKGEKGRFRCIPKVRDGLIGSWMNPGVYDMLRMYDGKQPPLELPSTVETTMLYEVELGAFETAQVDFVLPFATPADEKEMAALAAMDFDRQRELVRDYWHRFHACSGRIAIGGEDKLNDFAEAVPWHIVMSAMRDPVTGNFVLPAGSYCYGACGNEACMQIRLLDYFGYHALAEKYLETFIRTQGMQGLDGDFRSKEGAFTAVNLGGRGTSEDEFAYNLDHGYILACFADHYLLTGDAAWLRRVADSLVDGCDFVFRERQATMSPDETGELPACYGLLPAGHLEDNREWQHWFAVNAHACGGVLRVAEVLEAIEHPQAERIRTEGLRYRTDIRAALLRGMGRNPAVPTGNGGYMPHLPTHTAIRGRDWGWQRETAYGPLHLVDGLVLSPDEQLTTWILRDLEDNLFISRNYGRIADKEKYWFSRGGITVQSNLLFNNIAYLERQEPERAVRALLNNFAQNLYRDMNCFAEHPVPEFGHGIGPFFKPSDEAQFLVFLRNHLVKESGSELRLLHGAALDWTKPGKGIYFTDISTAFGTVSLRCEPEEGAVHVEIEGHWRTAPERIVLHLRRPIKALEGAGEIAGDTVVLRKPGDCVNLTVRL